MVGARLAATFTIRRVALRFEHALRFLLAKLPAGHAATTLDACPITVAPGIRAALISLPSICCYGISRFARSGSGHTATLLAEAPDPSSSRFRIHDTANGTRGPHTSLVRLQTTIPSPLSAQQPKKYVDTPNGFTYYSASQTRDGAVWQLVGLITRRSQVQILLPQPNKTRPYMQSRVGPFGFWRGM